MLYNVLVSTDRKVNREYIYISPLFWISLPFSSPQSIEESSLCYMVFSHQLFILYIVSIVYISIRISHFIPPCLTPLVCMSHLSFIIIFVFFLVQFSSVAQSCLTLCDPMDCSTPGLLVHHQLPESAQTHVFLSFNYIINFS